ncbi:MAG: beta-1-3, beta-1-6-glucan biosynthesis protein, partial [Xanthobacteraceae bacterium]
MSPRVVLGGLCAVLWLLAALLASDLSAFADNTDAKPVDQQANEPNPAEELQIVEFAEARRLLKGAAGNPECVWLGRRVVGLLWRDDLDTAFRHLDMYDRFGCP